MHQWRGPRRPGAESFVKDPNRVVDRNKMQRSDINRYTSFFTLFLVARLEFHTLNLKLAPPLKGAWNRAVRRHRRVNKSSHGRVAKLCHHSADRPGPPQTCPDEETH